MISIDLSKQQGADADPRAIEQINFAANFDRTGKTIMFFIIEETKKNCLRLFTRNYKSIVNVLQNNLILINIK